MVANLLAGNSTAGVTGWINPFDRGASRLSAAANTPVLEAVMAEMASTGAGMFFSGDMPIEEGIIKKTNGMLSIDGLGVNASRFICSGDSFPAIEYERTHAGSRHAQNYGYHLTNFSVYNPNLGAKNTDCIGIKLHTTGQTHGTLGHDYGHIDNVNCDGRWWQGFHFRDISIHKIHRSHAFDYLHSGLYGIRATWASDSGDFNIADFEASGPGGGAAGIYTEADLPALVGIRLVNCAGGLRIDWVKGYGGGNRYTLELDFSQTGAGDSLPSGQVDLTSINADSMDASGYAHNAAIHLKGLWSDGNTFAGNRLTRLIIAQISLSNTRLFVHSELGRTTAGVSGLGDMFVHSCNGNGGGFRLHSCDQLTVGLCASNSQMAPATGKFIEVYGGDPETFVPDHHIITPAIYGSGYPNGSDLTYV